MRFEFKITGNAAELAPVLEAVGIFAPGSGGNPGTPILIGRVEADDEDDARRLIEEPLGDRAYTIDDLRPAP